MRISMITASSILMSLVCPVVADYPVAGIEPAQRPAGAPVIEWVRHDKQWYQRALTGIQPPYPQSLNFLDNQGHWHTPFNQPGMTGRYDIRSWHRPSTHH